jgi:hypothetical protein
MQTVNPGKLEFLIRLTPDYFLASIDGHQITGTPVLSAAFHADYRAADRICAGLRPRGYPSAHVTDALGTPITRDMLLAVQTTSAKSTLPKTLAELDRIPMAEIKKRRKAEPEFVARVAELYSQGMR